MKLPGISKLGKIKGLKKEKEETVVSEEIITTEQPQEKKSRFGGFKLRKAKDAAVTTEPPQEKKSRFGGFKLSIKRNKDVAPVVQETVQEEQVAETQVEPLIEESVTEEFVQEPRKISLSRKKIMIIAPIAAVAIILGLPLSGVLPENQYLPNVVELVGSGNVGGLTSEGSSTSEQISELQFYIATLEDKIAELEEQLDVVSQRPVGGQQGVQGPQGPPGPAGPLGERGASTVPIMLTLGDRTTSVPNTIFIGQGTGALDYNIAKILIPVDGTMKNLFVTVSNAPNTNIAFTLVKNGFDTDLTCTLISSTACSDKTHAVSVKAGDTFAVKVSKDFPVNVPAFNIQVSMTLEQS